MSKICRICKNNMHICRINKHFKFVPKCAKYVKICKKYAKYVSQNPICRICTPHFADGSRTPGLPVSLPVTVTQAPEKSLRLYTAGSCCWWRLEYLWPARQRECQCVEWELDMQGPCQCTASAGPHAPARGHCHPGVPGPDVHDPFWYAKMVCTFSVTVQYLQVPSQIWIHSIMICLKAVTSLRLPVIRAGPARVAGEPECHAAASGTRYFRACMTRMAVFQPGKFYLEN